MSMSISMHQFQRRKITHQVLIKNIKVGGGAPVVVQSMTDTQTSDVQATARQIVELVDAGSEIIRLTVDDEKAARALPYIRETLSLYGEKYSETPLVGCFHYNGHTLLTNIPECAETLDKYRINPGNVGFGDKRDRNFEMMIESALKYDKAVRIGVNWGSLDKNLASQMMDDNAKLKNPLDANIVMRNIIIKSTLVSAKKAEDIGLSSNKIIISAKVSRIADLIAVYTVLAEQSSYALHLGLTEAGMGIQGITSTAVALGILLNHGIGDTIRASLTPRPNDSRVDEVIVCQNILQSLGLRNFKPSVTACPGCGRTDNIYFRELAEEIEKYIQQSINKWKDLYPGVENLKIAVMGCIVNGPGESKHSDIGISLPGKGESPVAPVFVNGEKKYTLRGDNIALEFKDIIDTYIYNKYK